MTFTSRIVTGFLWSIWIVIVLFLGGVVGAVVDHWILGVVVALFGISCYVMGAIMESPPMVEPEDEPE